MRSLDSVKDLMTADVIAVLPSTPLTDAASILFSRRLSGLPVVNDLREKKVVGILTDYDLVTKGTSIHLPTFVKVMKEIDLYRKDASPIRDDLKAILALTVKDVMNTEPFTLSVTASVAETAQAFAEHHRVNPIPVINEAGTLAGIVSRSDLIRFYAGVGSSVIAAGDRIGKKDLDQDVNTFLKSFDKDFVVVSKFRVRYWFLVSILFVLVGFIIAFALIVRVSLP